MNKVFCTYCKYYKNVYSVDYTIVINEKYTSICKSEYNIKHTYDWFGIDKIYDESPESRNKNNDCQWFVPKWWVRMFVPRKKWDVSWKK